MAGIYIHIPFCKKACHYCNFHFSTSLQTKDAVLQAMIKELILRQSYLNQQKIETIYFGGGTPSLLTISEIELILTQIDRLFEIDKNAEITLEANPDDISLDQLKSYKSLGINRLSIGIQSFHTKDLTWMNRSHNVSDSYKAIEYSYTAGIDNLSIDLIFGGPKTSYKDMQENLKIAVDLNIAHLSCYGLTVEPDTALDKMIKLGKTVGPDSESEAEQFLLCQEYLSAMHYEHYEISNYAQPNKYARHNTNYWKGVPYLGIGPSAHSYNGITRQWNIANNISYTQSLNDNTIPAEVETLSNMDQFNERLMVGLRTQWGFDLKHLNLLNVEQTTTFNIDLDFVKNQNWLSIQDNQLLLTQKGKLKADQIISSLFVVN